MASRKESIGRQLVLLSLDPLRRAHLEGKIEGLEKAIRMVQQRPDYSGNLLSNPLQEEINNTRMTIIREAEASYKKGPKE